jgi:4-amino-4-deoxy-L-arabinose transferase-like glycosyltransferase
VLHPKLNYIFPILVGVLFFLRGLQLQCVCPPLEGPDEYQHIAYIVYLLEEHKTPVFNKALVPKSLYPDLLANPHCNYGWEQTHGIGCLQYKDFYTQQPQQTGNPDIHLYQSQHPPLYYILVSPVFSWMKNVFGFREAVYTLRIINILLGAIAVVFLVSPVNGIFQKQRELRLCMLAASMVPMFMMYVSRVSNDSLALAFAGLAVYVLTRMSDCKYFILKAAIVGCLIGLGVLTKMIAFCLLLVSLIYMGYLAMTSRIPLRNAIICSMVIISCYLAVAVQYHLQNYHDFGAVFPSANMITNSAAHKTFLDLIEQIRFEHIKNYFVKWLVLGNLWTSGWSFILPNKVFSYSYRIILAISLLGLIPNIIPILRHPLKTMLQLNPNLVLCGLIVLFSFMAAYIQTLNSIVTYGQIVTVSYYVMIGYPALLICIMAAARGYGKYGVSISAIALILLFLATEYHSVLFKAVQHWTNATNPGQIFERLSSVHPAFPSPAFYFPLAVVVCLSTLTFVITAVLAGDGAKESNKE